ncbi:ABC transporter permease [Paenibacillus sp. FSL L8-0708]|uniref:ABC transporter permease n=1 Tax=Paenibacillus sp. FSL L8-0708 TaxID=2975311 RepID=UPI0030F7B538
MRITPKEIRKDYSKYKYVYFMAVPVVAYFIIFAYIPMYGVLIAFQDYNPMRGFLHSSWVGFKHFTNFFNSVYAFRIIKNTLLISVYDVIFGFPAPILLALLLNEVRKKMLKRTVQTLTYIPHFISMVVVAGLIIDFTSSGGLLSNLALWISGQEGNLLSYPQYFRSIYIGSGIWQEIGFGSIIYLAAIAGINPELYEAATMDGAGRWKKAVYVTLPCIAPTIIILFILRLGSIMNVGFEKILLLYSPLIYDKADVISTFVYRKGLIDFDYSSSAAIGLFNSVINFVLLVGANWLSRKLTRTSLW